MALRDPCLPRSCIDTMQVAEQQLHEPSSLTCLWDLGGLTPWEEARLGAMLRDLPALLEAQRAGDGGEGIAAANGEGQEADAEEADQVCLGAGQTQRRALSSCRFCP